MMSLKGSRPLFNTKTWIRRRRAADRDTAQKIDCFIDPRIYIFYDNFYLNTIKPYIHPNRLSILFPARLCWVFFDIVEANYYILSQNPGFVRRRPQVVPYLPTPNLGKVLVIWGKFLVNLKIRIFYIIFRVFYN